ncbi:hypothetical protein BKA81DRAFT_411206 [Phyllosticta paracitricarpa]
MSDSLQVAAEKLNADAHTQRQRLGQEFRRRAGIQKPSQHDAAVARCKERLADLWGVELSRIEDASGPTSPKDLFQALLKVIELGNFDETMPQLSNVSRPSATWPPPGECISDFLSAGCDVESKHRMVVSLRLPIKPRTRRSKRFKDMFLILPIKGMRVEVHDLDTGDELITMGQTAFWLRDECALEDALQRPQVAAEDDELWWNFEFTRAACVVMAFPIFC